MDRTSPLSAILGVVGVLCILAGAFNIMPMNYAIFAGIACFIIAGLTRRLGRNTI